jgi:very-short-patch-repair endonuclease
VTTTDFTGKIVNHIRLYGPSKAKQIALALGVDRTAVNAALYGPLRGKVQQGRDYTWSLAEAVPRRDAGSLQKNTRDGLFAYYLDCLSQDDDSGVHTFADSKFELDYIELQEWPLDADQPNFGSDPVRKLIARQRRDARKKTLWLGYPTFVHHVRSRKGWEGAFLEPLLLWPQDIEAGDLAFLPEPQINTRALKSLAASDNVLEEAVLLAENLGLDALEPPPLDELAGRLRDLRPEWDWKDELAPAKFREYGDLRKVTENGIYNAAVIVMADRSPFTVGLERELSDLRNVEDAAIMGSSLGALLGTPGPGTSIEGPLLEAVPLNAEQQAAVRQALSDQLTVITGPPGTGKSQVVTAILVNAAWRGLRTLFASKNNKAVDVVMERVNGLSPRPIMLRLGTRALQEQLAQHITAILSGRPTDDDRLAYETMLTKLRSEGEALKQIATQTTQLIELRNNVDKLERAAEQARSILPSSSFKDADKLPIADAEIKLAEVQKALQRSKREAAPLIEKLLWPLLKKSRYRELVDSVETFVAALGPFGFQPGTSSTERKFTFGLQLFKAIKDASAYKGAIAKLSNSPDTGALAAKTAEHTRALAEISAETWGTWTALLPDRLDDKDRAALGDYAAILRTISKADEEGSAIAKQVWRRYYQLAANTTKALPCWAVTSLSARGRVPFTAGDFDLLVIDEASQCDIASALPLLFRAKRAVVIGDPQQLRHISRLSEQRDQALMVKHNILDNPGPSWGYRGNGLYDLAAAKVSSTSVVTLRDHHRSHADIIGFSNTFFYGGSLRVATDYRHLRRLEGPAIRWINIAGNVVRPSTGGAVNQAEATAVVEELRSIAIKQRFPGEIGVVTPFRAQANLIEELLSRDDTLSPVLASRNFICETAHKFQGDERDLIVFSPVVSRGISAGATGFLKNQGNIFNVGITRARGALVVVGDAAACTSSEVPYLSAFARYVAGLGRQKEALKEPQAPETASVGYPIVAHPERVSEWEKVFYTALVSAGFRPIPQFDVDQYELDLALIRQNGRRLDIEIDGERYHRNWDGELVRRDQLRNLRLIEMGWDVLRFWVYEIRENLPACISRVAEWASAADAMPAVLDAGLSSGRANAWPQHNITVQL